MNIAQLAATASAIACPACKAPPGEPCHAPRRRRFHLARMDRAYGALRRSPGGQAVEGDTLASEKES